MVLRFTQIDSAHDELVSIFTVITYCIYL